MRKIVVARDGIEPPTQAFSGRVSSSLAYKTSDQLKKPNSSRIAVFEVGRFDAHAVFSYSYINLWLIIIDSYPNLFSYD